MSDQNFVYGVFNEIDKAFELIEKLHDAGFSTAELGVLGTKGKDIAHISEKVADPAARNFGLYGTAGLIGGLCAGIAGSPHIPNLPFQILTPLMAAISGGVVMAYFGSYMGVFLTSDKPQHWANVFEGTIETGSVIVLAECASRARMQDAMHIMEALEPVELIVRKKEIYGLSKDVCLVEDALAPNSATEQNAPTLAAVA